MRDPNDIGSAGNIALGVLVQIVNGIIRNAYSISCGVTAFFGAAAISDVVVRVFELLSSKRRTVRPIMFAAGELAKRVVFVGPAGFVRVGAADALVGVVVCVRKFDHR